MILFNVYRNVLTLVFIGTLMISCDKPDVTDVSDDIPPDVTITSPNDSSRVFGIIEIIGIATDNEGIEKVELWVDSEIVRADHSEPYSFSWITTDYSEGSHTIVLRAYDINENSKESEPITLIVDNPPTRSILDPIYLRDGSYLISWVPSPDNDFSSYQLFQALDSVMSDKNPIYSTSTKNDTTFTVLEVDETDIRFYQVEVKDESGQVSLSEIEKADRFVRFSKTFGGTDNDRGFDVQQTADGGYIITGWTWSFKTQGGHNLWLSKTDWRGREEWNAIFGGWSHEEGNSVIQTLDGGFLITGSTYSFGTQGVTNLWLVKTDPDGNEEWSKVIEENQGSVGHSVQQTSDGGYIITGEKYNSIETGVDVWLIKTNSFGNVEWTKTFDGDGFDTGHSVLQTDDGGYIVCGTAGGKYPFIIKTDATGTEQWHTLIYRNAIGRGEGYSIQQTLDGGYVIVGIISFGDSDIWLIKIDAQANELWSKTFGGVDRDEGYSIQLTSDGGYIIVGVTLSFGNGGQDIYLIKTDSEGNEEWNRTFGESSGEWGYSVKQTTDGGYVIVGATGGTTGGAGLEDVWLIKTDNFGLLE